MKKYTAVLVAVSMLLVAGCCTTHHATKWEYKTASTIDEVNRSSGEGWVVVGFSAYTDAGNHDYQKFLLKRPLR